METETTQEHKLTSSSEDRRAAADMIEAAVLTLKLSNGPRIGENSQMLAIAAARISGLDADDVCIAVTEKALSEKLREVSDFGRRYSNEWMANPTLAAVHAIEIPKTPTYDRVQRALRGF